MTGITDDTPTEIDTLRAEVARLRGILEEEGIDPDPQPPARLR